MSELKRLMKEITENAVLNGEHTTTLYDEVHYILHNMLGEEETNGHRALQLIAEEDFEELWDLWFGLADSDTILYKFREINHKYNLGLVEE